MRKNDCRQELKPWRLAGQKATKFVAWPGS